MIAQFMMRASGTKKGRTEGLPILVTQTSTIKHYRHTEKENNNEPHGPNFSFKDRGPAIVHSTESQFHCGYVLCACSDGLKGYTECENNTASSS